jgi:hypothetical protein
VQSTASLVQVIEAALARAVDLKYGKSGRLLFRKRLCVRIEKHATLQQVGRCLGVSRERIRLLEKNVVNTLRGVLMSDDYTGCQFRLLPETVQPIRRLLAKLKRRGVLLTDHEWQQMLKHALGTRTTDIEPLANLLLAIAGFWYLQVQRGSAEVVFTRRTHRQTFRRILFEIEQILTSKNRAGLTPKELHQYISRKCKHSGVTFQQTRLLVRSLSILETINGRVRVRLTALKRWSDIYERFLSDEQRPMRLTEMAHRSQQALAHLGWEHNLAALSQVLSSDSRFVPIGRTGWWALSKWRDVETRSIMIPQNMFSPNHVGPG